MAQSSYLHPYLERITQAMITGQGPTIDLWSESFTGHEFGYWSNASDAYIRGIEPKKKLCLPLLLLKNEVRDYPFNPPVSKFYDFLLDCLNHPRLFTLEEYLLRFGNKEK